LAAGAVSGVLPAGIRGLVISQLRLEGTVRQESANTMIAVVTNYTKRAYFLRVSDMVYNGMVSKITPEAVYFKENTLDSSGRVATREVEIKLGSATGEGR
jgi:Tfp pilus assembly protein PilP